MTVEEAKRLDHFFCESCSAEDPNKLANSHARHSDTKVISLLGGVIVSFRRVILIDLHMVGRANK